MASGLSENFYQLSNNKGHPAIWLLLDEHCIRMLADGRFNLDRRNAGEKEFNFMPFVKLFNPCGAATWLLSKKRAPNRTIRLSARSIDR